MPEMTQTERRYKARCIRALMEDLDSPKSVIEAGEKHGVSRATAYRILEELEAWDAAATNDQEIADISAQLGTMKPGATWANTDKHKWLLVSGRRWLAYIQGEFDPESPEYLRRFDKDPLLE